MKLIYIIKTYDEALNVNKICRVYYNSTLQQTYIETDTAEYVIPGNRMCEIVDFLTNGRSDGVLYFKLG